MRVRPILLCCFRHAAWLGFGTAPRRSFIFPCRAARIRTTSRRRPTARVWYTAQSAGRARQSRSEDGQDDANSARAGLRAAWRDRRPRSRGLGHRRRAERDRPRRPGHDAVKFFPLPKRFRRRQSQHRDVRSQRHALVHRPERNLRPRRPGNRQGRRMEGAERRRALRHHHHAERRGLVRLARRRSHRRHRHRERRSDDCRAAEARRRPAPHLVRFQRPALGELLDLGRARPLRSAQQGWKVWPLPKSKEGCYAVYVDDKDKVWVSDWAANAIHRFDPVTREFESFPSNKRARRCAANSRPARRSCGRAESGTDRLILIKPLSVNRRIAAASCRREARPAPLRRASRKRDICRGSSSGRASFNSIGERIAFISRAYLGRPYVANSLIGRRDRARTLRRARGCASIA